MWRAGVGAVGAVGAGHRAGVGAGEGAGVGAVLLLARARRQHVDLLAAQHPDSWGVGAGMDTGYIASIKFKTAGSSK